MEKHTVYSGWVLENTVENTEEQVTSTRLRPSRPAPRLVPSSSSLNTKVTPTQCYSNTPSPPLSNNLCGGLETDLEWGGIDRPYCNTWEQYSMNPTFNSNCSESTSATMPQMSPVPPVSCMNQPFKSNCSESTSATMSHERQPLLATPSLSTASSDEYPIVEPDNKYNHFQNTIETKVYSRDGKQIYYLRIQDILKYITLGGSVCDEYLSVLTKYVTDNFPIKEKVIEKRNTANGITYECEMPLIRTNQFIVVSKYCLDWVVYNPEKISM